MVLKVIVCVFLESLMKHVLFLFFASSFFLSPIIGLAEDSSPSQEEPSQEELMKKAMEAGMPSEGHKLLNTLQGTWKTRSIWHMTPEDPGEKSSATAQRTWILGGRFLKEEYRDFHPKAPFRGLGILGFDNVMKVYESTWVDTMTTATWRATGNYNAETKTFSFTGSGSCPIEGGKKETESELEIVNEDKNIYRMYSTSPEGKRFLTLEIEYTRVKGVMQGKRERALATPHAEGAQIPFNLGQLDLYNL
jgi:hypothetical protein